MASLAREEGQTRTQDFSHAGELCDGRLGPLPVTLHKVVFLPEMNEGSPRLRRERGDRILREHVPEELGLETIDGTRQRSCENHWLPEGVDCPQPLGDRSLALGIAEAQSEEHSHGTAQTVAGHEQCLQRML